MHPIFVATPGPLAVYRFVGLWLLALGGLILLPTLWFAPAAAAIGLPAVVAAAVAMVLLQPKRYEVWSDNLTLVFPVFRWRLFFDTITEARPSVGHEPYLRYSPNFVTISGQAVTIVRHSGLGSRIVISPTSRDEFLRHLQAAMEARTARPVEATLT